MKTFANLFLKGLVVILPLFITFGLIYWLFVTAERLLSIPLEFVLPEGWYVTGMGLVSAILLIVLLGVLVQAYLINQLFEWLDTLLEQIPFVKTLYHGAKDMMQFVARGKRKEMQQVVIVTVDEDIKMIGFVTNEDVSLGDQHGLISVYIPLSYQIGGFLAYLPRSRCEPLNIPVQQAMQQVLTAHVTGNHGPGAAHHHDKSKG